MATAIRESNGSDPSYFLRRDDAETQRLILQAKRHNPFTRWVLGVAGIHDGMTVLDIGSGAGDVALIAAELVGPRGKVIGVDPDQQVLSVARDRVQQAGLTNVEFVAGDCRTVELGTQFDAVVGRMVLMYVADPKEAIRSLRDRLRPDGIIALQEANLTVDTVQSWPALPTWRQVDEWVRAAARQAGVHMAMGFDLYHDLVGAGFPEPRMQLDAQVGAGSDWDGYDYYANTCRSLLPFILASGAATEAEVGIDTLANRMRTELIAADGVGRGPDLVSAWTRKP